MPLTRLDNGLTVVSDPMSHVDSLSIGVWVNAGARSESEGEHGIAHFLEHMAFKGTSRRTAKDIAEAIETVGGEINAATSVESTAYHARVLTDDLPLALDILSDILTDPLFQEEEIARERNVILQEIGAAEDMPEDRAFDAFPEAAFASQPLGRRILGTRPSVGAIDRAALTGFFQREYGAGAMVLCAAGAVDHDALVRAAEAHLGAVPSGAAPHPPKARYTGGTFIEPADTSECQWILGFEGRPATADDAVTAQITAMAVGGGLSSRLFQALREDRGLCYDTSAFHWAFRDTGVFAVHLASSPGDIDEASAVVLDELERAVGDLTEAEVDRAKAQARAGVLMSRESSAARMGQAARQVAVFGRLLDKDERIGEIDAVSAANVRTTLAAMLSSPPTLVVVGEPGALTREAVAERFGGTKGDVAA